jgi:hypothetical protein
MRIRMKQTLKNALHVAESSMRKPLKSMQRFARTSSSRRGKSSTPNQKESLTRSNFSYISKDP